MSFEKRVGSRLVDTMDDNEKYGGHLFTVEDMRKLFYDKYVVFVGDSVVRGFYKDFVKLLQTNDLLERKELTAKAEEDHCGDSLVYATIKENTARFKEVRQFMTDNYRVEYYFSGMCYNEAVDQMLETFIPNEEHPEYMPPDFLIMNSTLWDLTWTEPQGEKYKGEEYDDVRQQNHLQKMGVLLQKVKDILPESSMFIWLCAPPLASKVGHNTFLLEEMSHKEDQLRVSVAEANYHITQVVASYGFDVLDLHFYLKPFLDFREEDGVHWNSVACRHVTNLLFAFICDAIEVPLSNDVKQKIGERLSKDTIDLRNEKHIEENRVPSFTEKMCQSFHHVALTYEAKFSEGENQPPNKKTKTSN